MTNFVALSSEKLPKSPFFWRGLGKSCTPSLITLGYPAQAMSGHRHFHSRFRQTTGEQQRAFCKVLRTMEVLENVNIYPKLPAIHQTWRWKTDYSYPFINIHSSFMVHFLLNVQVILQQAMFDYRRVDQPTHYIPVSGMWDVPRCLGEFRYL